MVVAENGSAPLDNTYGMNNGMDVDVVFAGGSKHSSVNNADAGEDTQEVYEDILDAEPLGINEENGSARFALPTDLVQRTYTPIDAYFAPEPLTVTARILPSAGDYAKKDAGGYEEAFKHLMARHPLRAARLRDLYFRVQRAGEHRLELMRRDEAIRNNYNERNNTNNARLEKEIEGLREEWKKTRASVQTDIATARDILIKREAVLIKDATEAQKELWSLRQEIAIERDVITEAIEAARRTAEGKQQEKHWEREAKNAEAQHALALTQAEQDAAQTKAREEERAAERTRISDQVAVADNAIETAHTKLCAARERIAAENQGALTDADARLETARREADGEWDTIVAAIEALALSVEQEWGERITARREAVHAAHTDAARQHGLRQAALVAAEKERSLTAARAGIPVGDVETLSHREALLAHLPVTRHGKGDNTDEYLHPDEDSKPNDAPKWWAGLARGGNKFLGWCCLLVFGAIFGISLGLLFTAFNFAVFSDATALNIALPKLAAFFVIGTGVFTIMGRTIDHFVTLAVEASGTAETEVDKKRGVFLSFVAGAVVVAFVAVEAIIERFGIVESYISQQKLMTMGHADTITAKVDSNPYPYWAIALIAALPFALYHVGTAWRQAKATVATARRRADDAGREKAWLQRPEVDALLAAQNMVRAATAEIARGDSEGRALVAEAERHLAEACAEYDAHPARQRFAQRHTERDEFFETHGGIAAARIAQEKLWRDLDNDPEIQAARKELTYWEEKRNQSQQYRDRLLQILAETGTRAAEALIERVGETVGDVAHVVATNVAGNAGSAATATAQVAGGVNTLLQQIAGTSREDTPLRSVRISAMELRLKELEARRETDPEASYCRVRIKSLQTRLQRSEESYKARITSLKKQRRAIELKPGKYLPAEIADADAQIQIAQGLFEKEFAQMMRLDELPRLVQWFVSLRGSLVVRDPLAVHVDQAMEERKRLPAVIAAKSDEE